MTWSFVVASTLALAPPPATPEATESEPLERGYEGPEAVEEAPEASPAETATDSEPAAPTTAEVESGAASTEPSTTESSAETALPPAESPPISVKRPLPRALSTVEGFQADEMAYWGKRRVRFYPGLQIRNQVGWVSPFAIDRFGDRYEEGAFSTGRIRWNPVLEFRPKLRLVAMVDAVNGRWAPSGSEDPVIDEIIDRGKPPGRTTLEPWDNPRDGGMIDPRELYLEYRFGFGLLRVGQQAFTWGQGILANNGNYQDRFGDMRFGDDGPGDIYERILFATKPFAYRAGRIKDLAIGIGGDLVFRDERVNLVKGDLAGQALILVRYQPEHRPGEWIGGYMVYRKQKTADDGDVYPDDDSLEVGAADFAGQGVAWLRDDFQLIGGFEGAMIFGRTTIARDENGPHKILQGGAAIRGYLGDHDRWLVGFDAGYASGDPDPNDRWINNFTFDAGHTVGLVLFNQMHGWRSAQSHILATNGQLTGVPLNGAQFIPTEGGVTNAIYIHPKARYALWERLEFWGGPLIAAAPVPIVDPYTTRLNGGVPTNTVGGDGEKRYYGTELDLGIRGRFDIRNFWLQAGLQGGLLLPGHGLANAAGETDKVVGAVWFRTEIRY